MNRLKTLARTFLERFWGIKISRIGSTHAPQLYLSSSMINAAKRAGVYIGDYCEKEWGQVGKAERIVSKLFAPYLKEDSCVAEVGPGTGRYTIHMAKFVPHGQIHLFELDPYWNKFLRKLFFGDSRIILHSTNGFSYDLPDNSIDFYCANGVFTYTKPMTTYRNLEESVRITKSNGVIIFDFFDMDEKEDIFKFIASTMYPEPQSWSIDSLSLISDFMAQLGCTLENIHRDIYHNYHSTYAVFRKCK